MRMGLRRVMVVLAVMLGFASVASAQQRQKSWEVDLYGGDAEVTYVPDGRNDVHVYDHNNHYNDRSYIEVDRPYYRDHHRYDYRPYRGHHGRRGYGYRHRYDRPRYRVEYHHRHRHW